MSEQIIVRDDGFHPQTEEAEITLAPDTNPEELVDHLHRGLVAIDFPGFGDGRGFSLARRLRELGFQGRLRASGRLIADQYAMARRVGFDEVAVAPDIAARQPEDQWLARADWRDWDHRSQLAG
ncbi:DUF934 domain-containing protein [Paracoccus siganidrum]|uniref:DUF934 domain-containing protein n=1 Tax=Paracoccus siganidrum TaxID=1276757 RepID=A0A419A7M6_9RHOB|nr:DUF934 domain-containing protein [Paracoccus siganidrum]RJL16549.1 DUF934 domain-containing protein [Paracoccus siganidrum]RMC29476.1 hypothetical protein C9E82_20210 [Paracoccus siganidrum]